MITKFAGNGNTDGVRHLLDLGVDIAATCKEGDPYFDIARESTALHVAAWWSPGTRRFGSLIQRGAPVNNLADGKSRTPCSLPPVKACVDSPTCDGRRSPLSVAALIEAGPASTSGIVAPCGYAEVDKLLGLTEPAADF